MEYVYAAMLLHSAGKPINEKNLKQLLDAAGINPDSARVKALIASLTDVDIDEAIKHIPTITTAAQAKQAPTVETKQEAKEEKKEEEEKEKEEAALEGLGALFG